ncbi:ferritin-like domain-containing protein [Acidocella sp.]|uniref:YciE/YciF ferroxidase family protein n=1 Tax=Acidocella sp. TaxID=50710 RepID=UPI002634A5D9|nr:ferritin-like domain-containing protein [Acidocella sp.]
MGLFTTPIKTLDDLFLHTLKDIYYAENQITKALPKMIEKTTNETLKSALTHHLTETKTQITRLDKVFQTLGKSPEGTKCDAIVGIVDEAEQIMSDVGDKNVLDAAIASSAQAVEHYEISRYGTLIALAKQLGRKDVVPQLEETLKEEKQADQKLTDVANAQVNRMAA